MKLVLIGAILGLFFSLSGFASENVDCASAKKFADSLDELKIALDDPKLKIEEADELDEVLGKITDVVADISEKFKDKDFEKASAALDKAWDDMSIPDFQKGLAQVVAKLDLLQTQNCD